MQLHTPLIYGEKFEGLFHGRKTYCERIFSRVFGKWSVEVDGTGMMLLPEGDTLRNVSRVHLHQEKMVLSYSAITTDEDLTAYVDSIAVFTADSILNEMQNGIRDEVMDVYRWYATGYRYPVLDVILKRKNGQVKTEAYYLSPVSQEELYDAENELIRKQMAEMPSLAYSVSDHGAGSSPMSRCDISVSGQTVKIQFDLTELATVTGLVSDVPGLLLRKQSRNYEAGTDYEMELDCQGLRSGTYVLYLNVNGEVTSHLVNL